MNKLTNTLVHLDTFTGKKQTATTLQQMNIIRKKTNITKYLLMSQNEIIIDAFNIKIKNVINSFSVIDLQVLFCETRSGIIRFNVFCAKGISSNYQIFIIFLVFRKKLFRNQVFTQTLLSTAVFPQGFSFFTICLIHYLREVPPWWVRK